MSSKTKTKATKVDATPSLIPKLRFPEFRCLPPWSESTVGKISDTVTAGGTPSTSEKRFWGGEIRWMNSGELNDKKVSEVQGRITPEGLKNSSTKVIPSRCVLIGLAGQGKTRGTVAMNLVELCINQSIAAIFPNNSAFNSDFLYHDLDKRYDELRRLSAGGEGRGGLNLQIIRSLKIALPSLPEQQKIASCLSSLDSLITAHTQKLSALKTYKRGLMQQLFPREGETQPHLRFPEFQNAGEWGAGTLDDVLLVASNGLSLPQSADNTGYKVTRIETISAGTIDLEKIGFVKATRDISSYLLNVGDILFSNINSVAHIGKTVYVDNDYGLYHGMNLLRLVVDRRKCDPKFLFYLINTGGIRESFRERANKAVNQASINQTELGKTLVAAPSIPEQQRIASCLTSLDDLIAAQTQKHEALKTHKKGLMRGLFPNVIDP